MLSLYRHYVQKKLRNVKDALEDFWKDQGIAVEVSTNLTQVTNASRDVVLEFVVCGKYGALENGYQFSEWVARPHSVSRVTGEVWFLEPF